MRVGATLITGLVMFAASCGTVDDAFDASQTVPPSTTIRSETTALPETEEQATTTQTTEDDSITTTAPTSTTAPPLPFSAPTLRGRLELRVVNTYPHDPSAFTQGLELHDGLLLEGTGLYGASSRRRVEPTTGTLDGITEMPSSLFGAGLTVHGEAIIQLTWRSGVAIVADPRTLAETGRFSYEGEGWGVCSDGDRLVMSNGSDTLTFRDPLSFATIGSVQVTRDGTPVRSLNELECVAGLVWANVWLSSEILLIDPASGDVVATVDASALVPPGLRPDDVLNGIAHDADRDTYYLAGKRWDVIYEVEFIEP